MFVGGFLGDITDELCLLVKQSIVVCEPVPDFADHLKERFASVPKVAVGAVGLANETKASTVCIAGDATGTLKAEGATKVQVLHAGSFIDGLGYVPDLVWLNAEGAECDILRALGHRVSAIRCLVIRLHLLDDSSVAQRFEARHVPRSSHDEDWDFPFVWESWSNRTIRGYSPNSRI